MMFCISLSATLSNQTEGATALNSDLQTFQEHRHLNKNSYDYQHETLIGLALLAFPHRESWARVI